MFRLKALESFFFLLILTLILLVSVLFGSKRKIYDPVQQQLVVSLAMLPLLLQEILRELPDLNESLDLTLDDERPCVFLHQSFCGEIITNQFSISHAFNIILNQSLHFKQIYSLSFQMELPLIKLVSMWKFSHFFFINFIMKTNKVRDIKKSISNHSDFRFVFHVSSQLYLPFAGDKRKR